MLPELATTTLPMKKVEGCDLRVDRILVRSDLSIRVGLGCLLLVWFAGIGCSVRRYALNQAADAVAASGSTFASDDDPELVKAAPALMQYK